VKIPDEELGGTKSCFFLKKIQIKSCMLPKKGREKKKDDWNKKH
jgi:hypothetical protein